MATITGTGTPAAGSSSTSGEGIVIRAETITRKVIDSIQDVVETFGSELTKAAQSEVIGFLREKLEGWLGETGERMIIPLDTLMQYGQQIADFVAKLFGG